ncbi:hypothetical protein GCM10007164_18040 [Luteimonas padinae]|nr:hypothetical protein GCM10007164_18040 [Luteimonas padinae]
MTRMKPMAWLGPLSALVLLGVLALVFLAWRQGGLAMLQLGVLLC